MQEVRQTMKNLPVCPPDNKRTTTRAIWSNKLEYILSMLGFAIGLGSVWRFPYLAYKNGGGAFLIPYFIMLCLSGMPLFLMEAALGQFASLGPVLVWRIVPIVQGVGITMVVTATLVSIYFNVIVAYSLFYLFSSFRRKLPWAECLDWEGNPCSTEMMELCNIIARQITPRNNTWEKERKDNCTVGLPSKVYWEKRALRRSSGLNETGVIVWHLVLCNLLAWIFVAAALFKGIKSSGKVPAHIWTHIFPDAVVYFTALFPYIVLLILLVRGATLDGALDGIDYYVGKKSNFTKLWEAEVWKDAATQIFYSFCIAWGGLVTLSSYNKFRNNCFIDTIVVCVINALTSFFAGFVIFSILGHMAHVVGKPVSKVADSGFALAFIAYPESLTKLPISPFWSILFFLLIFTLGIDSQFCMVEILLTSIQDIIPGLMNRFRIAVTIGCCVILFLLGMPCVTQAGIFWVGLIDYYLGGWTLIIAALLELIAVSWIYGANRFILDIEMMIGKKPWIYWLWWRACWFCISPMIITVVLFWSLATFTTPAYGSIQYPVWGELCGWCMIICCIIWIPLVAAYQIYKADGNFLQRIMKTSKPAPNWGPGLHENRVGRYQCIEVDVN